MRSQESKPCGKMRSSSVEEVGGHGPGDPWEVFTALAILVVEGRTPGGERGYHAGPHCPLPHQLQHKHSCDPNHHVCMQASALVRQLRVMWGVGVGVTLEVLVAPECQHGAALATTLDTTTAPSQNLRLIEQWNFTIYDRKLPEATATGWSLMAAVRSFLHFSQLSAWLSVSGGRRPPNVLYRLTVTSPVFCSKFTAEAEEHVFPITYMGQDTSIKVSVRSLPRSEKVPVVECPEPHEEQEAGGSVPETYPTSSSSWSSSSSCTTTTSSSCQTKTDSSRCDDDLRRSVMKAKLVENTRVTRSESPDTQLGESLLDPPHSLTRFPRRYQSPSRSGSPSLETPEHLICRPRPPAPQNKPPDVSMMVGPAPTSHPFSWTQARYPLTPIVHQPSMDSMCPPSADVMHSHPHHLHHHQLAQNSLGFDFSGTYQPYRRPQVVYNRPQMCWPQVQPVMQHKPQQVTLHPQHSPLSVNPVSYSSQQKTLNQMSPRGGKYQHYPEYQAFDQSDAHTMTGEYPEPLGGHSDDVLVGEYQDPHSLRLMGEPSRSSSMTSQEGGRDQGVKRPGEHSSEWEYQGEHQTCKRDYFHKSLPVPETSQHNGDQGSPQCSSTRVKQDSSRLYKLTQEDKALHKILDDQMRPCCSHTGKHLCSSIEDLTEVGSTEENISAHLCPKELKQGLKQRGDMSPSHLYNTKVNFDLTPKETMEILSVLRQPTPLPPLRMDRHRAQYEAMSPRGSGETKSSGMSFVGDSSVGSKSWENKGYLSKFLKDRGKKVESKCWKEEKYESSHISIKGENVDDLEKRGEKAADQSWSEYRKNVGPAFPSSECSQGQQSERCHNKNLGRGREGVQELPPSPENLFLEAIARSGEKHCDIPSCKTLVDSRESYRTRACKDVSVVSCDNVNTSVSSEMNKCDTKVVSGKSLQLSSETKCIEAKKVTHKMSVFTASSEPAKPVISQPQKQTSQTLVKSPFSAVLSSIQKENNRVLEDEQSHCQETEITKASHTGREFVKRALTFEVQKSEEILRSETHTNGTIPNKERTTNEVGNQNGVMQNGKDPDRPLRDTREGFAKSTSLLKHLMTKGHHQTQDITQGNKQIKLEKDDMDWKELEEQQQLETQEMEVLENQEISVDSEVEKICNEKGVPIPSASAKAQFRRSLDSATNMVFHSKTGLPLTSSPAPLRKGKRFDYDSTLNCVAAIKSALYTCDSEEDENYSVEMSANNEVHNNAYKTTQLSLSAPATVTCSNLLGSFEECVLNGRLEPVSTVQGFTAEIAASGAFCPKRTTKPVTVFFYTLCDNDQISSPYMGHINLGKKGYHVPNKGTVQVTLFNPHGTVVKMFVVMYDLSDMPPNSRTFVRQRTLNMPVGASDSDANAHQWLRYLIHLRFVSSKSGKIYLHTDIRMLIFRKSDADAANLHKTSVPYELRSFTHGPTNPKFSPRK
ncbi:atos homolog protein A-like isoform X2 [Scylla paramamosain]